jgi:two-component system, chemotaxis family, protein-glutamate methylesterase/glutaminase
LISAVRGLYSSGTLAYKPVQGAGGRGQAEGVALERIFGDARQAPVARVIDVVVVAASLGGRQPLAEILGLLPADFPVPMVVVHHGSLNVPLMLAPHTRLVVKAAAHGDRLRAGHVYVAPTGGRHLIIGRSFRFTLIAGPRVNYARPAADVLFLSASRVYGARTLAVVLSGRLNDGAAGSADVRRAGGIVLAQDPATCRAPGMPEAAIDRGVVHCVLPPAALSAALTALITVPGATALFGMTPKHGGVARSRG